MENVEIPLVHVLAGVEWTGIYIDLPWFRSLKERFRREREAVEKQIYEAAGIEFNINRIRSSAKFSSHASVCPY